MEIVTDNCNIISVHISVKSSVSIGHVNFFISLNISHYTVIYFHILIKNDEIA